MQAATEKIRDVPAEAECHVAQFGYDEAQTQTRSTGRVRGEALRYMRHRKPRLQRGLRTGARKRQAMQSGTHFAKTGGFRLHGTRLFHACWGAAPIPAEHKNCVLERWINPSAARFFKSLVGGQLSAAPPLFPVVHSLPPAPYPAPEYGRYWPWPSAALSFPHGLFGSRRRPLSSPPAARRTRYSAP